MRDGRGKLDHVIGLGHFVQPLRRDQHAAGGAVENCVDQHRAQGAFAQLVKYLANPEAQERFVLQSLDRPLRHRLYERVDGLLGKFQLKQAR
ncbi:hypothetical protein D9M71_486100 [compost metagenome]